MKKLTGNLEGVTNFKKIISSTGYNFFLEKPIFKYILRVLLFRVSLPRKSFIAPTKYQSFNWKPIKYTNSNKYNGEKIEFKTDPGNKMKLS